MVKFQFGIHLLGLAGRVFSTGLYDISEKVGGRVFPHSSKKQVHKYALEYLKTKKYNKNKPIVLGGHSLGARAIIDIANDLDNRGYEVLLYLMDYVEGNSFWFPTKKVNDGIRCCHWFTKDRRVEKLYFKNGTPIPSVFCKMTHIQLDNDPDVQKQIYNFLEGKRTL